VRRYVVNAPGVLLTATVVTINCPLHEKTKGLFNAELISKMKKGEPAAHPLANLTGNRLLARQHGARSNRS